MLGFKPNLGLFEFRDEDLFLFSALASRDAVPFEKLVAFVFVLLHIGLLLIFSSLSLLIWCMTLKSVFWEGDVGGSAPRLGGSVRLRFAG